MARSGRPDPKRIGNARDDRGRPYRETLSVPAGTGITTGTGTIYETSIERRGDLVFTRIFVDLTGLNSSAAGDIIGVQATANCHLGRVVTADMGTIIGGKVECVEAPATGIDDIDVYVADESTGTEDVDISTLTGEVALVDSGGAWTSGRALGFVALPTANQYVYLVGSGLGADATYTAGQLIITFIGQA